MDWRVLDPQGGDPDACVLIDRAVAEFLPAHQIGQRRHADLAHPAGDVEGLPGEIVFHQIVQPRRAEDLTSSTTPEIHALWTKPPSSMLWSAW